jgi:alcohol dehydrogenase class IV
MNSAECVEEHFFAEVVGPRNGLPNGLAAIIFLYVLLFNIATSAERLASLAEVTLERSPDGVTEAAAAFVSHVSSLVRQTEVPTLQAMGVERHELPELALPTSKHFDREMGLNPRPLIEDARLAILATVFDGAPPESVR